MNPSFSLYLDLVRLCAALTVLLSHLAYRRISGGDYLVFRRFGSDAVILFFVMSGYVIAYVAAHRERTLPDYAASRLARLYSVALPALVLTILLDQAGRAIEPALYDGWWYKDSEPAFRFFTNLLFINELWFQSVRPFSNGPYWSLGYEFWYYALFGAGFYLRGRLRAVLLALMLLIIGPKILLLMPAWWMGVWAFRFNERKTLAPRLAVACILIPMAAYASIKATGVDVRARELTMSLLGEQFVRMGLKWSDEFVISLCYGGLVALHFIGVASLSHRIEGFIRPFHRVIRYGAGLSFSMYLLHYPLLHFYAALYGTGSGRPLQHALILISTLASIALVASMTEAKKHIWRRLIHGFIENRRTRLLAFRESREGRS